MNTQLHFFKAPKQVHIEQEAKETDSDVNEKGLSSESPIQKVQQATVDTLTTEEKISR